MIGKRRLKRHLTRNDLVCRVLVKLSNVANKRITELSRNMTMGRYRDEGGISSIRKALSDIEKREKDKYNSPATIG